MAKRINVIALVAFGLGLSVVVVDDAHAAKSRTIEYTCQNGPAMTVTYVTEGPDIVDILYVYDGPPSAMRAAKKSPKNKRRFRDGENSVLLKPNANKIEYREGADLFDVCTAVK